MCIRDSGLANQLNVSRSDAQQYVDRYFEKYPGVRNYMDQTQVVADEKGYVETILGRRRYLPDISAKNFRLRSQAERAAINMPIQGTAAEIFKLAMLSITKELVSSKMKTSMVLQIHDELIFESDDNEVKNASKFIKDTMTSVQESELHSFSIPLLVDINAGQNWGELH